MLSDLKICMYSSYAIALVESVAGDEFVDWKRISIEQLLSIGSVSAL